MPIISGGGGGGGVLSQVSKTLTDAQIKALHATPVELVAAPGPGKALIGLASIWLADLSGGFYTGIPAYDPASPLANTILLALDVADNDNSPAGGAVRADCILGGSFAPGPGKIIAWVNALGDPGAQITGPTTGGVVGGANQVTSVGSGFALSRGFENAALSIQSTVSGAIGGGGAGNTLVVTVLYVTLTL